MKIPYVDLTTGEVHNATKDSFVWWHEQGHIDFNNRFGSWILINDYLSGAFKMAVVFAFISKFAWFIALVIMAFQIIFAFFEEVYCDRFARKSLNTLIDTK